MTVITSLILLKAKQKNRAMNARSFLKYNIPCQFSPIPGNRKPARAGERAVCIRFIWQYDISTAILVFLTRLISAQHHPQGSEIYTLFKMHSSIVRSFQRKIIALFPYNRIER